MVGVSVKDVYTNYIYNRELTNLVIRFIHCMYVVKNREKSKMVSKSLTWELHKWHFCDRECRKYKIGGANDHFRENIS